MEAGIGDSSLPLGPACIAAPSDASGQYPTTQDDDESGRKAMHKQPKAGEVAYTNGAIPDVEDTGAALTPFLTGTKQKETQ